jgi:hypothetical protein
MRRYAKGDPKAIEALQRSDDHREISDLRRSESIKYWTEEEVSFLLSSLAQAGMEWEEVRSTYAEYVRPTENLRSRSILELIAKAKELKCEYLDRGDKIPEGLRDVPVAWPRYGYRGPVVAPEKEIEDEASTASEMESEGFEDEGMEQDVMGQPVPKEWNEEAGVNLALPVLASGTWKKTSLGMKVHRQ